MKSKVNDTIGRSNPRSAGQQVKDLIGYLRTGKWPNQGGSDQQKNEVDTPDNQERGDINININR